MVVAVGLGLKVLVFARYSQTPLEREFGFRNSGGWFMMLKASARIWSVTLPSFMNLKFFAPDTSRVVVTGERASPRVRGVFPICGLASVPGTINANGSK